MTRWQPRIPPPLYFLASVGAMVALHRLIPGGRLLSGPLRLVGAIPLILGITLSLSSAARFRASGTPLRPGSESTLVVQSGAFRYTRNPMYLGFVLGLLGVALLLGTVTPLVGPFVFLALIQVLFIRHEERVMEERFGERYLAYKRVTRRWL